MGWPVSEGAFKVLGDMGRQSGQSPFMRLGLAGIASGFVAGCTIQAVLSLGAGAPPYLARIMAAALVAVGFGIIWMLRLPLFPIQTFTVGVAWVDKRIRLSNAAYNWLTVLGGNALGIGMASGIFFCSGLFVDQGGSMDVGGIPAVVLAHATELLQAGSSPWWMLFGQGLAFTFICGLGILLYVNPPRYTGRGALLGAAFFIAEGASGANAVQLMFSLPAGTIWSQQYALPIMSYFQKGSAGKMLPADFLTAGFSSSQIVGGSLVPMLAGHIAGGLILACMLKYMLSATIREEG